MVVNPAGSNPEQQGRVVSYFVNGVDDSRVDVTRQVLQARQWILQNIIRANLTAGPIFTAITGNGYNLFTGLPGRVFQVAGQGQYYNSGTSSDTMTLPDGRVVRRYIPPMYITENGHITFHGIRPFEQRPNYARNGHADGTAERRREMINEGIRALDLIDTGRRTPDRRKIYRREGFNGDYIERRDGGIEFSGGSHESGGCIRRQIYYSGANAVANGRDWFEFGPDIPPPPRPIVEPGPLHNAVADPMK